MAVSLRMIFGFGASVVCAMLCGIALSFNVFAVPLKGIFNLTQTQDELLGAFSSAGWSGVFVGAIIYQRYGYVACYVITTFLLTSWGVFMRIATSYQTFFKHWIGLMYFFQYCSTAGGGIGYQLLSSITIEHFPKHTGKIVGVYVSVFAIGNAFYSALYEIAFTGDPQLLGMNFLTCGILYATTFSLCAVLHRPPVSVTDDQEIPILVSNEHTPIASIENKGIDEKNKVQWRYLFTSCTFYVMIIPTIICNGIMIAFINNISVLAYSVGVTDYFKVIYLFTAALFVLRPVVGGIYDHFQSQKVGAFILLCSYVTFSVAMFLGIFDLNNITVYVIIGISTYGCAVDFGLLMTMMTAEFGTQYYALIVGAMDLVMAPVSALCHLVIGITYDRAFKKLASPDMLCPQCLQWMFIILIISVCVSAFFVVLYLVMKYKCRQRSS